MRLIDADALIAEYDKVYANLNDSAKKLMKEYWNLSETELSFDEARKVVEILEESKGKCRSCRYKHREWYENPCDSCPMRVEHIVIINQRRDQNEIHY